MFCWYPFSPLLVGVLSETSRVGGEGGRVYAFQSPTGRGAQ